MKTYISWSGGKDSTASVILAHLNGIPIDLIIISLPYFDKAKGIYADHPLHIDFIFNRAIPTFESWGYKVNVVSSDKDYKYWFFKKRGNKCKNPKYNGKYYGWLLGGMRQGCFFCPYSPIGELAKLQRDYSDLWQELLDLNELYRQDKTQFVAQGFKYGITFDEIINEVNAINNQITIFDLIGDK